MCFSDPRIALCQCPGATAEMRFQSQSLFDLTLKGPLRTLVNSQVCRDALRVSSVFFLTQVLFLLNTLRGVFSSVFQGAATLSLTLKKSELRSLEIFSTSFP